MFYRRRPQITTSSDPASTRHNPRTGFEDPLSESFNTYHLTCSSCHVSFPWVFIWNKIIREAPVMAASVPSFSRCDVVPQQCYRRTAEESPAVSVSAPTATNNPLNFTAQGSIIFTHNMWPANCLDHTLELGFIYSAISVQQPSQDLKTLSDVVPELDQF